MTADMVQVAGSSHGNRHGNRQQAWKQAVSMAAGMVQVAGSRHSSKYGSRHSTGSRQQAWQQVVVMATGTAAGSRHSNKAGSWESTSLNKSTKQRKRETNGKRTRLYNLKLPDLTLKPLPTVPLAGNQVFESKPISYSNHHSWTRQRLLR